MFQFAVIFPAGDKTVVKIPEILNVAAVSQAGVGIIGENQIHRAVFQKIRAFDRSLIGDFNMDFGILSVKTSQVGDQEIPADRIAGADADLSAA